MKLVNQKFYSCHDLLIFINQFDYNSFDQFRNNFVIQCNGSVIWWVYPRNHVTNCLMIFGIGK